jgi:hypothetical protein
MTPHSNKLKFIKESPRTMACSKFLSFAEIVKGDDHLVKLTDDNLVWAVDLAMVVSGEIFS